MKAARGKLYHPHGTGTAPLAITLIDVRELLPEYHIQSFADLRNRRLLPLLEARYEHYIQRGGEQVCWQDVIRKGHRPNPSPPPLRVLPDTKLIARAVRQVRRVTTSSLLAKGRVSWPVPSAQYRQAWLFAEWATD